MLDVASLETAPLALDRSALSLTDLVAAEVALFTVQAGRRGIAIQLDAQPGCCVLGSAGSE